MLWKKGRDANGKKQEANCYFNCEILNDVHMYVIIKRLTKNERKGELCEMDKLQEPNKLKIPRKIDIADKIQTEK